MENNITFGRWETGCFITNLICFQIFLNYPRAMVEIAGTAGWMVPIYSTIIMLIAFMAISALYSNFEGKDLLDIGEIAAGHVGRVIVGIITLGYLVFIITVVLREFAEDMKAIALINTPVSFVILFFIVGMAASTFAGIEAIVRTCAIIVPVIAIGFYFIILAVIPYFDLSSIFPLLGNGLDFIFIRGAAAVSNFSSVYLLFFFMPFIKSNKNLKRVGYSTIIYSAFNLVISVLIFLSANPYPTALESFLPIYQIARLINYGRFFQRVESVFVFIWASSALLYLCGGFFFILQAFRKTFGLKYYKPLTIPMAILVFNISLLPPNVMMTIKLDTDFFRKYIWVVTVILPLVLLLAARFRSKKGKKRSKIHA